jgi:hypothetical protein
MTSGLGPTVLAICAVAGANGKTIIETNKTQANAMQCVNGRMLR